MESKEWRLKLPVDRRYLFFTGEDAFEGCLVSMSTLGMPSVPALDGDCCLVHLLNKPSNKKQLVWLTEHQHGQEGKNRRHRAEELTSRPPPQWPPSSVAGRGCHFGLMLETCYLKWKKLKRNSSGTLSGSHSRVTPHHLLLPSGCCWKKEQPSNLWKI